jgi:hypothetical protein
MFLWSHTDPVLWRDMGKKIVYILGGEYRVPEFSFATDRYLEFHHGSSHSHAGFMLRLCFVRLWQDHRWSRQRDGMR